VQHSAVDVGGAEVVSSAGLQGQLTKLEEKEAGASPQRQAAAAVADREDEDGAGARQRCSSQNPTTQRTMALAVGLVHGACHAVRCGCGAVRLCVVSCCSRHSNYTITRPVRDTLVSSRGCDRTARARVIVQYATRLRAATVAARAADPMLLCFAAAVRPPQASPGRAVFSG
jgi:hypothetical protein